MEKPLNVDTVKQVLELSLQKFYEIPEIAACIEQEHIEETPQRIVKAMLELFDGCWRKPENVLSKLFNNVKATGFRDGDKIVKVPIYKYDEILYVNDITFVSMCAHHNLPFFGKAHFGYLPGKSFVGLSKIPRLVEVFAKRPQVQEQLTVQIADSFNDIVKPRGCGLVMEAYHLCMAIRGVECEQAYTKTTVLRGAFKEDKSTKAEYLDGIRKTTAKIWP